MTTANVGSTASTDCKCLGNYKRKSGTQECIRCGLGEKFVVDTDNLEEGVCEDCPAGYYQENSDHLSPACVLCPADTYRVEAGGKNKEGCLACRTGAESDAGSTSAADCACTTAYITQTGTGNCIQCEAGEVFVPTSDGSSEGTCNDCGAGWYQDALAHRYTECAACPIGRYRSEEGGGPICNAADVGLESLLSLFSNPDKQTDRLVHR